MTKMRAGTRSLPVVVLLPSLRMTYGATAALARLNVGQVRNHIAGNTDDNRAVVVVQDPLEAEDDKPADPSHALMADIPDENDPEGEHIGDLIAECVLNIFPAKAAN